MLKKFRCRTIQGAGFTVPWAGYSVTTIEVEVQELLLRPDATDVGSMDSYEGGRVITLTFGSATLSKGIPINWTGTSNWHFIKTQQAHTLEDFIGKGAISGGGATLADWLPTNVCILFFYNAGGVVNIDSAPGLDLSVPGMTLGYWGRHGDIIQQMPPDDVARLQQLEDEEKAKHWWGPTRILTVKDWTKEANRRLIAELTDEKAFLQTVLGRPSTNDATRTWIQTRQQQIDLSIERSQWNIRNLGGTI